MKSISPPCPALTGPPKKKTARRTWQKFEQRAAAFFGALRQRGSGSGGREDQSCSDSTHERIYIECKLREKQAVRSLHDDARAKAKKEGKTPVLCLADKSRPGFLVVIHSDDFGAVVEEWLKAKEASDVVLVDPLR